MAQPESLLDNVRSKINQSNDKVFLLSELRSFCGGTSQVKRVARSLVQSNELVRIGTGVYAKTWVSRISGETVMAGSLPDVGREALRKLRIPLAATAFERDLRDGVSTQVPTGRVVGVGKRTRRRLSYRGRTLELERV